jgi:hypothetical protein
MGAIHAIGFTEQMHIVLPGSMYLRSTNYDKADDRTEYSYTVMNKKTGKSVATFRARPLPGCCGVLVVYYLRPSVDKTAEKVFGSLVVLILKAAGQAKFGQVIFTQANGSTGAKILSVFGSRIVAHFTNWKTKNGILTFLFSTVPPKETVKKRPTFDGE